MLHLVGSRVVSFPSSSAVLVLFEEKEEEAVGKLCFADLGILGRIWPIWEGFGKDERKRLAELELGYGVNV